MRDAENRKSENRVLVIVRIILEHTHTVLEHVGLWEEERDTASH